MLLKLIPPLSEPTIHFTISFSDLPTQLPVPAAWAAQFNHLLLEELEVPITMLSLDKAAGLITLIEEVAFDIAQRKVFCHFIDGATEEWNMGLEGDELSPLEEVINFVQESTLEDEREKERIRERERERQLLLLQQQHQRQNGLEKSKVSRSSGPPSKSTKHKKQRSLFMQFVSSIGSIINLSSPSSSTHRSYGPPDRQDVEDSLCLPPIPSNQRARALRRSARSCLVDTFRRYVLPVLLNRGVWSAQQGGFCLWILFSMKRRINRRLEQILEEVGLSDEEPKELETPVSAIEDDLDSKFEPTTMQVLASFSDTESESLPGLLEDDEDMGAETDGSSLHTPSTFSHQHHGRSSSPSSKSKNRPQLSVETYRSASALSIRTTSSSSSRALSPSPVSQSPASSSQTAPSPSPPPVPPKRTLSTLLPPDLYNEHTHLVAIQKRVEQLISFRESQTRVTAEEQRARMEVLSVRGKRRAWSNGLRLPGSGGNDWGFSVPFRSSPLARHGSVVPMPSTDDEDEDEEYSFETLVGQEAFKEDEERLFRPSCSPSPSVSAFPISRPRERKHCRSWQQEGVSDPLPQTSSTYDYTSSWSQRAAATHPSVRRRRIAAASGTVPLSRLFPVSEELEREIEMEHGHDPADEILLQDVDPMGTLNRRRSMSSMIPRNCTSSAAAQEDVDAEFDARWGSDIPAVNASKTRVTSPTFITSRKSDEQERFEDFHHHRLTDEEFLFDDMEDDEDDFSPSPYPYPVSPSPSPPHSPEHDATFGRGSPSPPAARRREAFELERPQVMPRVRTRSMRMRVPFGFKFGRSISPPLDPDESVPANQQTGALGKESLLYQPFAPPPQYSPNPVLGVSKLRPSSPHSPQSNVVADAPNPGHTAHIQSRSTASGKTSPDNLPAAVNCDSEPEEVQVRSSITANLCIPEEFAAEGGEEFTLAMDVVSSVTKLSSSSRRRRKMFSQLQVPIPTPRRRPSLDQIFSGIDASTHIISGTSTSMEDQMHVALVQQCRV